MMKWIALGVYLVFSFVISLALWRMPMDNAHANNSAQELQRAWDDLQNAYHRAINPIYLNDGFRVWFAYPESTTVPCKDSPNPCTYHTFVVNENDSTEKTVRIVWAEAYDAETDKRFPLEISDHEMKSLEGDISMLGRPIVIRWKVEVADRSGK